MSRTRSARPRVRQRRDIFVALAVSLLVALVWGSPVFRMLPVAVPGDAVLHAGWAEQLINGESTPSAPLTGDIPNYYPWLFHSLLALVTHLTPGAHALLGLAALHLLQVIGMAASLFGIGYLWAGRWAGATVAVLGAAAGGWGFTVVGGLDLVTSPRADGGDAATTYLGDLLLVRSYNASFMNLAPSYPRDVAIGLLAGSLFAMARAANSGRGRDYAVAGVLLGLVGLTQTDSFVVGLLAAAALAAWAPRGQRLADRRRAPHPGARPLFAVGGADGGLLFPPGWFRRHHVPWTRRPPGLGDSRRVGNNHPARARRRDPSGAIDRPSGRQGDRRVAGGGCGGGDGGSARLGSRRRGLRDTRPSAQILAARLSSARDSRGLGAHWLGTLLRERSKAAAWVGAAFLLALAFPSPVIASLALPSAVPRLSFADEGARGVIPTRR